MIISKNYNIYNTNFKKNFFKKTQFATQNVADYFVENKKTIKKITPSLLIAYLLKKIGFEKNEELTFTRQTVSFNGNDYEILLDDLQKEAEYLPKNLRSQYKARLNLGLINKDNIFLYKKVFSNKSLLNDATVMYLLDCTNSKPKSIVSEFILNNFNQIKKIPQLYLSVNDILSQTHNEDLATEKIFLISTVINDGRFLDSAYCSEIIANANSLEDAQNMYEFSQNYVLTPQRYSDLVNILGEEISKKIIDEIYNLKNVYEIHPSKLELTSNQRKEPFIIMKDTTQKMELRFDRKDGKLLSVSKDNVCLNLDSKKIILLNNYKVKRDKDAMPGHEKKLLSGALFSKDLESSFEDSYIFKKAHLKGEFKLFEQGNDGHLYRIGLVEFDKKGGYHIEKHLTSNTGEITDYVYAKDKKGNSFLYQTITNKDGQILSKTSRSFKRISENHHISSVNGQYYDTKIFKDEVVVTKLDENKEKTDEIIKYKIVDITDSQRNLLENCIVLLTQSDKQSFIEHKEKLGEKLVSEKVIEKYTVDRKLLPVLKELSGAEWFNLYNSQVYAIHSYNNKAELGQSCGGFIQVYKDFSKDAVLSILLHEIGHEKFEHLKLYDDDNLKQIYEEEKRIILTSLPKLVVKQLEYFLENPDNAISEACAEINMINNVPVLSNDIVSRSMFLQKYFPKTFAYVQKRFENIENPLQ